MADQPEWLTMEEVADHYRRSVPTIRYWRHIGYGPKGVKVGTGVLYPRAEVERFDQELAAEAGAATS
jgi:Helix-turn-helix domain